MRYRHILLAAMVISIIVVIMCIYSEVAFGGNKVVPRDISWMGFGFAITFCFSWTILEAVHAMGVDKQ